MSTVSDEENPMLLHKPAKPKEPDIWGRDIPIDGSQIPVRFATKLDPVKSFVRKLTGADGGIAPVVKLEAARGDKINCSSWDSFANSVRVFVGIKGTF